ncbi:hypothetical protein N474_25665 [Pseudoalteromonas luteoviolacea CPMOR-2]|uniref:hypothetical protein n=1 Tax=Pseudoalteromonas luteoviolacea TaxID=43657 RepID=UPI0007B09069|nr:hypothetical protein [Pseudoalteromonas luteoviolacea]KZN57698.1 hypothetical protein N474_25665 [Pseudoalteromonas luteoviolacea CPMOR-2]
MKSNYKIANLNNLGREAAKKEMQESDFIISKRGNFRDAISYIGDEKFENIIVLGFDENIEEKLLERHESHSSTNVSIDISLIDRKRLAEIFYSIARVASEHHYTINVVYTLAEYNPPSGIVHPNNNVKPVSHFFSGWSNRPGMPILSIVGLGYERDKAAGAIEFLESSKALLFVPQSSEERYFTDVCRENEVLMGSFGVENQFTYNLESPIETLFRLDSLISAYKIDYKVVLLPFGPKIFYALSLLACIPHPEVSAWFVSGEDEDSDSSQDRKVFDLLGFSFDIESTQS